jgi:hypothetical protein
MEYTYRTHFFLDLTLNSSEAIMFSKGGKHTVDISFIKEHNLEEFNKVEVSIQINKSEQSGTDWIVSEAQKHRAQWDSINAKERRGLDSPPPVD